jgi:hypothetical protein
MNFSTNNISLELVKYVNELATVLNLALSLCVYTSLLAGCTFCPKRNKVEQEAIAFLARMRSFYTF